LIGEGEALAFKAFWSYMGISSPIPSPDDSSDEPETTFLDFFAIVFLRDEGGEEDFLPFKPEPEPFFFFTSSMVRATFSASLSLAFSSLASLFALGFALFSTSSGKSAMVVRESG
jgi:hypothetical protein